MSGSAVPVDVAAMTHAYNVNDEAGVNDFEEDSEVADSHPVHRVFSGEFGAARRSRFVREQVDRCSDPLLILAREFGERLYRSPGDLDRVAAHWRPSIAFTSSHGT